MKKKIGTEIVYQISINPKGNYDNGLHIGLVHYGRQYQWCKHPCNLRGLNEIQAVELGRVMKADVIVKKIYERGKCVNKCTIKK
jgi:hypothetical protein